MGYFGDGTKLMMIANLLVTIHNIPTAEARLLAKRAYIHVEDIGLISDFARSHAP